MKKLLTCLALAAFLGAVGCNEGTGTSSKKPGTGGNVPATEHKSEPTKAKATEPKKNDKDTKEKKNDKTPEKPSK